MGPVVVAAPARAPVPAAFPDVYAPARLETDLLLRSRAAGVLIGGRGAIAGYSAAEPLGASSGPEDAPADGRLCLGDGAVRHRAILEANGGVVPPDDDPRHVPRSVLHASLATTFGPVDAIEPIYVRAPDAERWRP